MNRMSVIIAGIFITFFCSWIGLVAYPYLALGRYLPFVDEDTGDILPPPLSGLAERGQQVYASSGCIYCHSQQVGRLAMAQTLSVAGGLVRRWLVTT